MEKPGRKPVGFELRPMTRTVTGRLDMKPAARPPARRAKAGPASIRDFDRDALKAALLAVVGKDWIERDDAIRAAAQRLGFARLGKRIRAAFASAVNGLIRQGRLEYDGSLIRRTT